MRLKRLFQLTVVVSLALSGCVHLNVLQVRNQAEQLYKEGRTAEIIPLVEAAMIEVEEELGPDHRYLGEAYSVLAVLYAYTINDFDRAHDYFQRALRIRTKALGPEHPDTIETVNLMGYLYQITGELDKAEAFFQKALEARTRVLGPRHPDTADSQVYLSGLYLMQGRYAEAETLLLEAVQNEAQEVSARYPSPAESHAYLGALYYSLGDLDRAKQYHLAALEIREAELASDHTIVASSLDSLAAIFSDQENLAAAEAFANRSLKIKEKRFGWYHGFTGDSLAFLGRLQIQRKNPERAADYYHQALEVYQRVLGPDNYRSLIAKLSLAALSVTANDLTGARALCEEVLSSPAIQPIKELKWNALVVYSVVLSKSGMPNAAVLYGKQAVNIIQGLRSGISEMDQALQKGFVVKRDAAFRHLAALLIEQGRLPEAQQVLTMIKEQEHFDFIRRELDRGPVRETVVDYTAVEQIWLRRYRSISDRLAAIGLEYEGLKRKKALGLDDAEEAHLSELRKDLGVAKQAFRRFLATLERELETVSRQRAMDIAQKNLGNLKAMQGTLRRLGEDVVLIHYLISNDKLYIILTTNRVQIVRKVTVDRAEVHRRVYRLREALQDPRQYPQPQAKALYDLVLDPIVDDLRQAGARTLMFAMDGVLRYVPVGALHDGKRYLAEDYEIVLFTEAAQTKLISRPSEQWNLAGLGVTRAVGGFSALPAVAAELNSIVRTDTADRDGVLPGVIYLDERFTEETIVDVLEDGYSVIHVASHFVFQPGTERDSYLLLGDGNKLSLAQMLDRDLDFNSVELLTLSACETALGGAGADGREIEGFGWLAQRQGAMAVLATLWSVGDKSTAVFMKFFYQYRQSGGLTKAAAIRKTQIEFIDSQDYSHPFYWAPFILMGNWL